MLGHMGLKQSLFCLETETAMRRFPQQNFNHGVHRERDARALKRQLVLLVCGLAMAGGFVVAAGQHFAAVRYGYDGEKLRAERVRLMQEQQQLILQINAATAPASLDRAAREIGMQPARPTQINRARTYVAPAPDTSRKASAAAPKSSRTRSVAH
jgi:cell division protein FtsL